MKSNRKATEHAGRRDSEGSWPTDPECAGCGRSDDECILVETARGEVPICPRCLEKTEVCAECGANVPPGFNFGGTPSGLVLCEDCEPLTDAEPVRKAVSKARVSSRRGAAQCAA